MSSPVYATRTDLTRLGILSKALVSVSTDAQDEALDAGSRMVDSYLRSQFVLPLVQWGSDVTRAVCVLATWDLLVTRGFNPESAADTNIRIRYEDTIRWLEKCASGLLTPDVTDSSPGASEGVSTATPNVYSASQRGWSSRGSFGRGGDFVGN